MAGHSSSGARPVERLNKALGNLAAHEQRFVRYLIDSR